MTGRAGLPARRGYCFTTTKIRWPQDHRLPGARGPSRNALADVDWVSPRQRETGSDGHESHQPRLSSLRLWLNPRVPLILAGGQKGIEPTRGFRKILGLGDQDAGNAVNFDMEGDPLALGVVMVN